MNIYIIYGNLTEHQKVQYKSLICRQQALQEQAHHFVRQGIISYLLRMIYRQHFLPYLAYQKATILI